MGPSINDIEGIEFVFGNTRVKTRDDITHVQCSGFTHIIPDENIKELIEYNHEHNPLILMEEPAELIKAISKCYRDLTNKHKANLIEEMADVLIVIDMLMYELQIDVPTVLREVMRKMDRNMKRARGEEI